MTCSDLPRSIHDLDDTRKAYMVTLEFPTDHVAELYLGDVRVAQLIVVERKVFVHSPDIERGGGFTMPLNESEAPPQTVRKRPVDMFDEEPVPYEPTAAAQEVARLREMLDQIHAVMAIPYEWDPDTIENVSQVLTSNGYTFPEADEFPDREYIDVNDPSEMAQLAPWRPKGTT